MKPWATEQRKVDDACATIMGVGIKTLCDMDGVPIGTPHYSTDPALARLLEDEIERRGLQDDYLRALLNLVLSDGSSVLAFWKLIRATPEQRAQAFLKAVNHDGKH